ncbi:MAG TPA: ATP-binding protein [Dermatophilaceae bacterium]|nr:ATP-binding protein [Dermatophilaceae bacterium]
MRDSVTLPPDASAARAARTWIRDRIDGHRIAVSSEDCELVVTELVSNALRHGQGPPELGLEVLDGHLRLTVRDGDGGVGKVHIAADRSVHDISGRGLRIVEALVDDWGVTSTSGGKLVWVLIRYAGPSDGSGALTTAAG